MVVVVPALVPLMELNALRPDYSTLLLLPVWINTHCLALYIKTKRKTYLPIPMTIIPSSWIVAIDAYLYLTTECAFGFG